MNIKALYDLITLMITVQARNYFHYLFTSILTILQKHTARILAIPFIIILFTSILTNMRADIIFWSLVPCKFHSNNAILEHLVTHTFASTVAIRMINEQIIK
jgi:hypothetical protein